MYGALSRLPEWELDTRNDDIRGWALRDVEGHTIGVVGELIVDTDTRCVSEVELVDGRHFPAHDVRIGNHVLTLERLSTSTTSTSPGLGLVEEPRQTPTERLGVDAARKAEEMERAAKETRDAVAAARARLAAKAAGKVARAAEKVAKAVVATEDAVAATKEGFVTRTASQAEAMDTSAPEGAGEDLVVPLVDEELEVSTRRVDAGGVRATSHVVEEPVEREVLLREETIRVQRRALDRPASGAEAEMGLQEATLEMHATAEQAVVAKDARVVEEIVLKKGVTEHEERVSGTVRHTDVEITKLDGRAPRKGDDR